MKGTSDAYKSMSSAQRALIDTMIKWGQYMALEGQSDRYAAYDEYHLLVNIKRTYDELSMKQRNTLNGIREKYMTYLRTDCFRFINEGVPLDVYSHDYLIQHNPNMDIVKHFAMINNGTN